MYLELKTPWPDSAEERSRATERAIELAISSGLILAPGRVLLEMEDELKPQPGEAGEVEQVGPPVAA